MGEIRRAQVRPPRRTDVWMVRLLILATATILFGIAVFGLVSIGVLGNSAKIADVRKVAVTAKQAARQAKRGLRVANRALRQGCVSDRREHKKAVRQLRQTRRYIRDADAAERESLLYRTVVRTLPQTRADVKDSRLVPYCRRPRYAPSG